MDNAHDWKSQVLICPKTGERVFGSWPHLATAKDEMLPVDELGIVASVFLDNIGTRFHDKMVKGAVLRELQNTHLHLSYWETPYYEKAVSELMLKSLNPADSIVADIGCGDGRFTAFLLQRGFQRVIAVDADIRPLRSLAQYAIENGVEHNLLLIHASAVEVPIRTECLDGVLAIGVLYYLNEDFVKGLRECVRMLKPSGVLINSEPDLEGAIYKSAFFEDIDDILENFEDRLFKEERGRTDFKFRLFARDDVPRLLHEYGMQSGEYRIIPLLPSIVRIKMVRGEISFEDIAAREQRLRAVMDHLAANGLIAKHCVWKSVKQ